MFTFTVTINFLQSFTKFKKISVHNIIYGTSKRLRKVLPVESDLTCMSKISM